MLLGQAAGAGNILLLTIQVLCFLFALALALQGIKGVRGIPDQKGNKTNLPTAIALFVVAVGLVIFVFVLPKLMG